MPKSRIDEILNHLYELQKDLETEIDKVLTDKRALFQYTLEQGKVRFEEGMRTLHASQQTGIWQYLKTSELKHVLVSPVIYSLFIPIFVIDVSITLYQQICFRVYGIPLVKRGEYFIYDRQQLAYLNFIEKVNCNYCSYSGGVFSYAKEIVTRTEQYWCPIKHSKRTLTQHYREEGFVDFGDADTYKDRLDSLRKDWSDLSDK